MTERTPEPAAPEDLDRVLALAAAAGLPTSDVAERFPHQYSVVRVGAEIVGVAGLESYGRAGLLRTVAVAPSQRCTGLGRRLVEDRLRVARKNQLEAVYLLTTTAAGYFRQLGFVDVARDEVPAELQRSSEFASVCPASAACLVRRLDEFSSPSDEDPVFRTRRPRT